MLIRSANSQKSGVTTARNDAANAPVSVFDRCRVISQGRLRADQRHQQPEVPGQRVPHQVGAVRGRRDRGRQLPQQLLVVGLVVQVDHRGDQPLRFGGQVGVTGPDVQRRHLLHRDSRAR